VSGERGAGVVGRQARERMQLLKLQRQIAAIKLIKWMTAKSDNQFGLFALVTSLGLAVARNSGKREASEESSFRSLMGLLRPAFWPPRE
jgi:hypothetical protein